MYLQLLQGQDNEKYYLGENNRAAKLGFVFGHTHKYGEAPWILQLPDNTTIDCVATNSGGWKDKDAKNNCILAIDSEGALVKF